MFLSNIMPEKQMECFVLSFSSIQSTFINKFQAIKKQYSDLDSKKKASIIVVASGLVAISAFTALSFYYSEEVQDSFSLSLQEYTAKYTEIEQLLEKLKQIEETKTKNLAHIMGTLSQLLAKQCNVTQ